MASLEIVSGCNGLFVAEFLFERVVFWEGFKFWFCESVDASALFTITLLDTTASFAIVFSGLAKTGLFSSSFLWGILSLVDAADSLSGVTVFKASVFFS